MRCLLCWWTSSEPWAGALCCSGPKGLRTGHQAVWTQLHTSFSPQDGHDGSGSAWSLLRSRQPSPAAWQGGREEQGVFQQGPEEDRTGQARRAVALKTLMLPEPLQRADLASWEFTQLAGSQNASAGAKQSCRAKAVALKDRLAFILCPGREEFTLFLGGSECPCQHNTSRWC